MLPKMVNRNLWNQARNLGIKPRFQVTLKKLVSDPLEPARGHAKLHYVYMTAYTQRTVSQQNH